MINNIPKSSFSPKRLMSKLVSLTSLTTLFLAVVGLSSVSAAGSGQLTLTPASGSYLKDSTLKVTVNSTSTDAINAVEADLNYDTSQLEFISVDKSASAFTLYCSTSGGGGSVKIGCAHSSNLTGTNKVADVSFKVLVGSGSTAITFASSSAMVRPSDGQNVWNGATAGGTYTLTSPETPPSTPPATSPPTKPTTSTPSTSTPSTSTKPSPTTADPATPAQDTVEKPGYLVAIKILDKKGNPVVGKTVYIGAQSAVSDDNGIASFVNIKPGTYDITEEKDGKGRVLASVTVNDTPGDPYTVQEFAVNVAPKKNILVYVLPIIGFFGIIILLLLFRAWYRKFRAERLFHKNHFPDQPNKSPNTFKSPAETTPPSVQPSLQSQKSESGQTVLPNAGEGVTSKKPIVWSGDGDK